MAVTSQQIIDFLLANPGMSDAQIVAAMEQYGVSPAQMAQAVGLPEGEVVSRVAATIPEGMSVTLGDTRIAPQYEVRGSGEDRQVVGIENIYVEKTTGDVNYKAPVGSEVQVLSPTGEFVNTIKTKEDQSFFGGLVDAFKDPVVLAALGGAAAGGLLGTGGALGGTAATVGTTGLTAAELAQLDLALGGAGGTAGATSLANALATGAAVPTLTNLTGGSGVLTGAAGGITADSVAAKLAADATTGGGLLTASGGGGTVVGMGGGTGLTAGAGGVTGLTTGGAGLGATGTGAGLVTGAGTGLGTGLGTTLAGVGTGVGTGLGTTLAGVGTGVGTALGTGLTAGATGLGGLTAAQLGALLSGGLTLGGGLMQSQTSKEAAQAAQARIDAETAAAKTAAQFRPVGMTTRFGTSQFQVDPVTGQLTSAGYTLSPEAKAAQDRFVALAGQGLTQAEAAQKAFEPLQTGATSLFTLGNKYLAQSPEQVAKDYLAQQMALLQPGRELELANLQNKLQQQGRAGLSVAQGGSYGATTPELQALYNARAMQEAQLAAQAQQAGQQQVTFGAGLLGQGAQAMGQYYGGQTAAYQPYTTALGQVQALETAAQQPLTMGASLGQTAAQAGANMGRLGLTGAAQSVALATGANATANPYAQALMAAGNPNAMFGSTLNTMLGGLFGGTAPVNALESSAYGTGTTGFQNMLNDIYG